MRLTIISFVAALLCFGYANPSAAQDMEIVEVTWTTVPECEVGTTAPFDIFVDARGPSPGDIIISGTVDTCLPDLGPFLFSSTACENQADMMGFAMAVDALDENNMDAVEFTIRPCETGGQVYDGTGGTGGTAGSGGDAGGGGAAGSGGTAGGGGAAGTGGDAGGGGAAGSGGTMNGDDQGGCDCAIHSAKLDHMKIGFGVALIGVLVVRRLRRRRR